MIDAYEFYLDTIDKVKKNENGYVGPDMFTRTANMVSLRRFRVFNQKIQDPEIAQRDKQALLDMLSPFSKIQILPVDSDGVALRPNDWEFHDALAARYDDGLFALSLNNLYGQLCDAENDPTINAAEVSKHIADLVNSDNYTECQLLDHAKIGRRLRSFIPKKRPNPSKPIAEQLNNGYKIFPSAIASVRLVYYRKPAPGKLAMQPDNTGELQYDAVNSIAWEWTSSSYDELVTDVAQEIAIQLRERDLFQMTEIQKNKS